MEMKSKLPFVGRIFWKVFVTIVILLVASWILIPRLSSYEITNADYGGSSICSVILSYLIHLWLLPPEGASSDDA